MRVLLAVVFVLAFAVSASAQAVTCAGSPVTNPAGSVTFTASADHSATQPVTGIAILTKYVGSIFANGSSTALTALDYGKPTPGSGNTIAVSAWPALTTFAKDTLYCYRLDAVGPGGTGSAAPIPFVYPGTLKVPTTATGVTLQ